MMEQRYIMYCECVSEKLRTVSAEILLSDLILFLCLKDMIRLLQKCPKKPKIRFLIGI